MPTKENSRELAKRLVEKLRAEGLHITAVESCTGGALASRLTDIPGASEVLKDSFVTYSDEAKKALGIPAAVFTSFGVYSPEMARAMAEAGLCSSVAADIAVGITGQLTDESESSVDVAVSGFGKTLSRHLVLRTSGRPALKEEIVETALCMTLELMEQAT